MLFQSTSWVKIFLGTLVTAFLVTSCQKEDMAAGPEESTAHSAASLWAAAKSGPAAEDKAYDQAVTEIMRDMMQEMQQMEMTCDPDVDFARMMIMHHEAGIKMSEAEIAHGHEEEAKMMAREAIENDEASIARLEAFLASHPQAEPLSKEACREFLKEMKHALHTMMQCMRKVQSRDVDVAYARQMICHHQGALAMSQMELKYGNDEAALHEAEMIIEEQSMHIRELQEFVDKHGVSDKK
jgi:uncharacterized protein (DUF305 family)